MAVIPMSDQKKNKKENPLIPCYKFRTNDYTDKYWSFFFFFVFIIWQASWHYFAQHKTDYEINHNNNITATIRPDFPTYLWGKNWIFDSITGNLAFMGRYYEESGLIVIAINVLFAIFLIAYSSVSLYLVDIVCCFIIPCAKSFLVALILYSGDFHQVNVAYDKFVSYWWLPEAIYILIRFAEKTYRACRSACQYNNIPSFLKFYPYKLITISLILPVSVIVLLRTVQVLDDSNWCSPWPYIIIGGSVYVCLTSYYLGLMIISCAISISINRHRQACNFNDYWNAVSIIIIYHFGTACYHATLIFPRIHATFIMNEKVFKEAPRLSRFSERFHLTHWRAHEQSLLGTAALGDNYSESVRNVLRMLTPDAPPQRKVYIKFFSLIFGGVLMFLLAMNNLMLMVLWTVGLDYPPFSMATWLTYMAVGGIYYVTFVAAYDALAITRMFYVRTNLPEEDGKDDKCETDV